MVEAATEFKKNSFSDSDSATLAKVATMFTNVADEAMSASDSASFIIAQMKAFGIEAENAQHIIDSVNAVSNNYAVSSGDLARNLGNMSAALAVGNNSFEESLALLTAGAEVTQNASKVSRALVTVQSRLNQTIDESSSTGKALTEWYQEHNIAILDQEGQLRSLYDVLTDVAEIWPDLTKNEQAYYLNQQAGANQTQNLSAILSNFETAQKAVATALESTGSAAEENSRYMESLEAKQQALSAEFEDFANRVLSKDVVSGFMSAGTAMLEFSNNDVGAAITRIGLLGTGVTGLVGIVGQTVGKMAEVGLQLKNLGVSDISFLGMLGSGKFALMVGGATLAIGALVEIIKAVNQAVENNKFENLVADMDEANQELADTKEGYEETKKRLDELNNTPYNGNVAELEAEREQLEKQIEAYEKLLELRQTDAIEAARKVITGGTQVTGATVSGLGTDEFGNGTLTTWQQTLTLTDEQTNALKGQFESVEDAQEAAFEALEQYIDETTKVDYYTAVAAGNMDEAYNIIQTALSGLGVTITETKQKTQDWAQSQGQSLSNWSKYTQDVILSSDSATQQVGDLVESTEDYYNALKMLADNGEDLDQWQVDFIANWETLNGVVQNTDVSGTANDLNNLGTAAEESASKLDTYLAALDQYRGANDDAANATGTLVNSLFDANGQLTEAGKQALSTSGSMASMAQSFIQAQQAQAQADFSALILAIQEVGSAAAMTSAQIANMMAMAGVGGSTADMKRTYEQTYHKSADADPEAYKSWLTSTLQKSGEANYKRKMEEYQKQLSQISVYTGGTGGGGGSSSTKKDQEEVKAQTINTIEELRDYLTDESTRLKLIDPDISKSDLQSTLSEVATIYQSYQDYLSQLKQQGFDETSDQYKQAEAEFAQFVETLKTLFSEIVSEGTYSVDELVGYIEKNCGDLSGSISSLLDGLKDKISSTVSSVTGSIHQAFASGDANSAISAIENAWGMIREMDASIEERYDAAVEAAIANASAEKSVAEEVSEEYDRQNQLLEDKIALEEKLEALERAKQRRMLVYSEGRFQYMQDADAISSAQADYQETYRGIEQSQKKDLLDMLGDKSSEIFKKYFSENQSYQDVMNYPEYLRKQLLSYLGENISGTVYEGMSADELYSAFGSAMQPGEAYKMVKQAAIEAEEAREQRRQREAELKKLIREENVKSYGVDTDFGKKILESQSQEEAAYWTKLRDTKLEMMKEYREAYGDEAASKYFGTDVSKITDWKTNQDLYKEAWENQSDAWVDKASQYKQDEFGYIDQTGSRSNYKKITAALLAAEYNAVTGLDMEGLGDQRLWNRIFTEQITKDEIQDLYNKAKYDITKGNLLNLAREMKNNGVDGYARGTRGASGGLSLVGENGPELRVLNQGDGILPNGITDNLWRWGSMTPSDMLTSLAQKAQSWAQTLNISNVTLPNVRDAQSFVSGLRELAQQYVTRRS